MLYHLGRLTLLNYLIEESICLHFEFRNFLIHYDFENIVL
jgi:hypothetical protein